MSKAAGHQPWLSVIIPTLNEAETLPVCLAALLDVLPEKEMEIIIADGGSDDGTLEITAGLPRFKTVRCTRGRARQMNAGAAVATGKFLWFLHADTLPPGNWLTHLRHAADRGFPASFSLALDNQSDSKALRFYSWGSRINHWAVRFGDQSLFVSRDLFVQASGYRDDHQLMEGHELVRRLTRRAGGFTLLTAAVTTSGRRYRRYGFHFTQAAFTAIFVLYYLGFSQERLAGIYRRAFP